MSDKKKDPETLWDSIKHLSVSNQVKALCDLMAEAGAKPKQT